MNESDRHRIAEIEERERAAFDETTEELNAILALTNGDVSWLLALVRRQQAELESTQADLPNLCTIIRKHAPQFMAEMMAYGDWALAHPDDLKVGMLVRVCRDTNDWHISSIDAETVCVDNGSGDLVEVPKSTNQFWVHVNTAIILKARDTV